MKLSVLSIALVRLIGVVSAANCGGCGGFDFETEYIWDIRGGACEYLTSNGPQYTNLLTWGQAETFTWGGWSDGYCWDALQDIIQQCFAAGCSSGTWELGNEWFWMISNQEWNPATQYKRDEHTANYTGPRHNHTAVPFKENVSHGLINARTTGEISLQPLSNVTIPRGEPATAAAWSQKPPQLNTQGQGLDLSKYPGKTVPDGTVFVGKHVNPSNHSNTPPKTSKQTMSVNQTISHVSEQLLAANSSNTGRLVFYRSIAEVYGGRYDSNAGGNSVIYIDDVVYPEYGPIGHNNKLLKRDDNWMQLNLYWDWWGNWYAASWEVETNCFLSEKWGWNSYLGCMGFVYTPNCADSIANSDYLDIYSSSLYCDIYPESGNDISDLGATLLVTHRLHCGHM